MDKYGKLSLMMNDGVFLPTIHSLFFLFFFLGQRRSRGEWYDIIDIGYCRMHNDWLLVLIRYSICCFYLQINLTFSIMHDFHFQELANGWYAGWFAHPYANVHSIDVQSTARGICPIYPYTVELTALIGSVVSNRMILTTICLWNMLINFAFNRSNSHIGTHRQTCYICCYCYRLPNVYAFFVCLNAI